MIQICVEIFCLLIMIACGWLVVVCVYDSIKERMRK